MAWFFFFLGAFPCLATQHSYLSPSARRGPEFGSVATPSCAPGQLTEHPITLPLRLCDAPRDTCAGSSTNQKCLSSISHPVETLAQSYHLRSLSCSVSMTACDVQVQLVDVFCQIFGLLAKEPRCAPCRQRGTRTPNHNALGLILCRVEEAFANQEA